MLRCKLRNKHEQEEMEIGLILKKVQIYVSSQREATVSSAILISNFRIRNVVQANSVYDMLNTGLSTQS